MPHTLRTKEGIERLLSIEEGKSECQIHKELEDYIIKQKIEHPQRDEINIARGYLIMRLQRDYRHMHITY